MGIALVAGLVAGAVTQLLQGILPAGIGSIANSATPWLAVAFGVGSTAPRWWLAAIAGAVTLLAALVGYYGLVQLRFGYGPELRGAVLLWLIAAVVGGPVFGVAGRWWRGDGPWLQGDRAGAARRVGDRGGRLPGRDPDRRVGRAAVRRRGARDPRAAGPAPRRPDPRASCCSCRASPSEPPGSWRRSPCTGS